MAKIIINGEGAVFGRLCSYAAKRALEGDEVAIVNSERIIITGNKKEVIERYKKLRAKGGHSLKGPKYSKISYTLVKRGVRGMLPDHRKGIGKDAFKRVKCYDKAPKEFEGKEMIKMKTKKPRKFIELNELSKRM